MNDVPPTLADWVAFITALTALVVAVTNLLRAAFHTEPRVRANTKKIVQLSETVNGNNHTEEQ